MSCLKLRLARPLVVFDLETTGLYPRKDRIIEIGAIKVNPDGTEESKSWLLNPTIPIPKETSAIHGITDDIVKDCPTFADKAEDIAAFFEGCDLGGFNCDRYDIPCLEEEFARVGINFGAGQRKHVDVQRIYHRMEPRDLSAALEFYCGRSHEGAHGAEADTRATLDVLKAQMERKERGDAGYAELPDHVDDEGGFEGLDEYLVPHDPLNVDRNGMLRWRDGELCINFGKNKGDKVKDLMFSTAGKRFLEWMLKGDFDTEVKMIIRDALENGRLPKPTAV